MCFCGGWVREIIARVQFYEYAASVDAMKKLEEELQRRTLARGVTGRSQLEDLQNLLQQMKNQVLSAKLGKEKFSLTATEQLIERATLIVGGSADLYTVSFGAMDGSDVERELQDLQEVWNCQRRSVSMAPAAVADPHTMTSLWSAINTTSTAPEAGCSWDFDVLQRSSHCDIYYEVGWSLLSARAGEIGIPDFVAANFLNGSRYLYEDSNPYHNSFHSAHVAHYTILLIQSLLDERIVSPVDHIAVVVGSLCHDIGHPGRTSVFLALTHDPLAVVYNDQSILENFHACLTFKCLDRAGSDLFASLDPDDRRDVRSKIIELILATDMESHFNLISLFRVQSKIEAGFDFKTNAVDAWATYKICIKAGDLSHGVLSWNNHLRWSKQLAEELYGQGDEEAALGLPRTALCDRTMHSKFCSSQEGFLRIAVRPLFDALADLQPEGQLKKVALTNLDRNRNCWRTRADAGEQVMLSPVDDASVDDSDEPASVYSIFDKIELLCFNLDYLDVVNRRRVREPHDLKDDARRTTAYRTGLMGETQNSTEVTMAGRGKAVRLAADSENWEWHKLSKLVNIHKETVRTDPAKKSSDKSVNIHTNHDTSM
eukprot:CAMPEP_0113844234 /NCGR_PEP_ID=MMETSP0372-20130328/135_1 /TAXON_ID=340204 /ORGANISM="Lankesteria abbotti" /LENGTH=599 /DNA_ID=CAMNT_0000813237 /DNA_START=848 /DNA_END=2648 /DNA_ORIENTATION=- /assembly_acc=CAM_ASM_000359